MGPKYTNMYGLRRLWGGDEQGAYIANRAVGRGGSDQSDSRVGVTSIGHGILGGAMVNKMLAWAWLQQNVLNIMST